MMDLLRATASLGQLAGSPMEAEPFEVAFDRADAIWMRGYCRLLSAMLEFVLAHDWSDTFGKAAGVFYPNLRADGLVVDSDLDRLIGEKESAGFVADIIAILREQFGF